MNFDTRKAMTSAVVLILISTMAVSLVLSQSASAELNLIEAEPSPVVSVAFDDGTSSSYTYAYPLMRERGICGTFYVTTNLLQDNSGNPEFMSYAELIELQNNGNEIGSHSVSHRAFTSLSEGAIRCECQTSKAVLESYGLEISNFAYPYGARNDFVDSIVKDYYVSARSAYKPPYIMSLPIGSQFVLPGFAGETGDSTVLSRLKNMVDQLQPGNWAIIFFHDVKPDLNTEKFAISTQDFAAFLDYLVAKDATTKTVNQVLLSQGTGTTVSFTLSPNPATPGQTVELHGTLTEVGGGPVYPAQVRVEYSANSGATWSYAWTLATNAAGQFVKTFTALGASTYLVRVSYAGSTTYNPSSHTETLTVQQIGSASIEIWTDKAAYARGQTLKAYIQGFNPGPAVAVRVKCWFGLPGGGTYMLETYYTGTIPASYTSPVYLWKSVTIPTSAAVGTYSVNAEMRNPTTNALIDSDTYYFTIT